MPKFILTDGYVEIATVDLSDHAHSLDTPQEKERVDVSGFNSAGTSEFLPGAKTESCEIGFRSNFAASKVHATLQPLIGSSTGFTLEIRPTNSARSTTNPAYLMTALLFNYNMLDGKVGDASSMSAEFVNAAQAGVTYPTA